MPNVEIPSTIPPALMSELRERAELAARGVIDSHARKAARGAWTGCVRTFAAGKARSTWRSN